MIGIICGGGEYPRLVARACVEKKLAFCLIFLHNFCNQENWPEAKSISINFGEIGKAIDFLNKNRVKKLVFAGKVQRPNFNQLSLDKKGAIWLLKLGKTIFAGDDALLKIIAEFLQKEGFKVIAGTSLLYDVFLPEGVFSSRKPSVSDYNDIKTGLKAAREWGHRDLGQSIIIHEGKILGKEDISGTDALIEKSSYLRKSEKGGILVKVSKPQQDDRLDLPTIGVKTIEILHKNGFVGIAIEADKCIVINREEVIKKADKLGIFLIAIKAISKKIFIIAGEASGDYLGGILMDNILEISDVSVEFFGIGGECMRKAGLNELFSIDKLSIMGIFEIIGKIFYIKKLINETVESICSHQPDLIITIDSSGFTHRVAKKIKKMHKIPIIHYVAPPVWAWRPWRAKSIHKFIDKLMILFPFEQKYFKKLKTVFVGHPIATDLDFTKPSDSEIQSFLLSTCKIKNRDDFKIVTMLPGSRVSEITNHLPVLEKFAQLLTDKYKNVNFIIPTIEKLESKIKDMTKHWIQKPVIVTQKSQKILSYYSSNIAIAASGTVAIELARVGLPFVVIYKTSLLTYHIVKLLIKVKNVCLINLLAKKNVVPELLQCDCTAEKIFEEAEKIIDSAGAERQKKFFANIMKLLKKDPKQAAKEVYADIRSW